MTPYAMTSVMRRALVREIRVSRALNGKIKRARRSGSERRTSPSLATLRTLLRDARWLRAHAVHVQYKNPKKRTRIACSSSPFINTILHLLRRLILRNVRRASCGSGRVIVATWARYVICYT
eukprot:scaffold918_cov99-Isochrysis_galbana.AAC.2